MTLVQRILIEVDRETDLTAIRNALRRAVTGLATTRLRRLACPSFTALVDIARELGLEKASSDV